MKKTGIRSQINAMQGLLLQGKGNLLQMNLQRLVSDSYQLDSK